MIDIFNALLIWTIPWLLGLTVMMHTTRRNPLPLSLSLALAFGLGSGILTQWILILAFFQISYTALIINIPLLSISLFFLLLSIKRSSHSSNYHKINMPLSFKKLDTIIIIFVLYIIILVGYIFWRALNLPINSWDSFSTMAFKAKIFYYSRSLTYLPNVPKFAYPIHVPLLFMWSGLTLDQWSDQLPKIVFPLTSTCFLVILYHFLRHFTSKRWSLFGLVLLLSSNFYVFHSTIAYRDITIMYYNCATIMLLLLWNKKREEGILLLAGLFSGFTTFVKLEGLGYLFVHTILLFYILFSQRSFPAREKCKNALRFAVPGLGVCMLYFIYKFTFLFDKLTNNVRTQNQFNFRELNLTLSGEMLTKFGIVLKRFLENCFLTGNWNIIWFLLIISLINARKKEIQFETKALLLAVTMFFIIYIAAYTLTQHFIWVAYKDDVLSRSLLHFFPLIIILIILINSSKENLKNNS